MSICPKNKSSKARRDKRRANWKMSALATNDSHYVRAEDAGSQDAML